MQKYKGNVTTSSGSALRNVSVFVLAEDGSVANIFRDRYGSVAIANPLTTASDGTYSFYAANGRYSLRCTVEGVKYLDDDVALLFDPADSPDGAGLPPVATQAEAEDGTNALVRMFTPQRVWQATAKWWTADPTVPAWAKAATKPGYTKTEVGLGNVDNTSDLGKPISTATQAALNTKQATLLNQANIKSVAGGSLVGSGDLALKVKVTKFTASGTYTPIAGLIYAIVEAVGGGGAGGTAQVPSGSTGASGGSGGGGGAYSKSIFYPADLSPGMSVVVGAGGLNSAWSGGDGGTTYFGGTLLSAPGGHGGHFVDQNAFTNGPPGVDAGVANLIAIPGSNGRSGFFNPAYSSNTQALLFCGDGGDSRFGTGGKQLFNSSGTAPNGYGGGGGGSFVRGLEGISYWGLPGAPGVLFVTEYYWG